MEFEEQLIIDFVTAAAIKAGLTGIIVQMNNYLEDVALIELNYYGWNKQLNKYHMWDFLYKDGAIIKDNFNLKIELSDPKSSEKFVNFLEHEVGCSHTNRGCLLNES